MRWRLLSTTFLIVGIVFVGVLWWLSSRRGYQPPEAWETPPIYPGAHRIGMEDDGRWGIPESNGLGIYVAKVITLTTSDNSAEVEAFYANTLEEQGWRLEKWGRSGLEPWALKYSKSDGRSIAPSVYFIDVTTYPFKVANQTKFVVGTSMYPGR
jgi:hypothetical protein